MILRIYTFLNFPHPPICLRCIFRLRILSVFTLARHPGYEGCDNVTRDIRDGGWNPRWSVVTRAALRNSIPSAVALYISDDEIHSSWSSVTLTISNITLYGIKQEDRLRDWSFDWRVVSWWIVSHEVRVEQIILIISLYQTVLISSRCFFTGHKVMTTSLSRFLMTSW